MHARVNAVRSDDAANRDRPNRSRRAGIGHDRGGAHHGRANQGAHRRVDLLDIAELIGRLRGNVRVDRDIIFALQGQSGRGLKTSRRREGIGHRAALLQDRIGRVERRAKPLALRHSRIDQVLSADYFDHLTFCFCRSPSGFHVSCIESLTAAATKVDGTRMTPLMPESAAEGRSRTCQVTLLVEAVVPSGIRRCRQYSVMATRVEETSCSSVPRGGWNNVGLEPTPLRVPNVVSSAFAILVGRGDEIDGTAALSAEPRSPGSGPGGIRTRACRSIGFRRGCITPQTA